MQHGSMTALQECQKVRETVVDSYTQTGALQPRQEAQPSGEQPDWRGDNQGLFSLKRNDEFFCLCYLRVHFSSVTLVTIRKVMDVESGLPSQVT